MIPSHCVISRARLRLSDRTTCLLPGDDSAAVFDGVAVTVAHRHVELILGAAANLAEAIPRQEEYDRMKLEQQQHRPVNASPSRQGPAARSVRPAAAPDGESAGAAMNVHLFDAQGQPRIMSR